MTPLTDPALTAEMKTDALRQLAFFHASLLPDGRLATLDQTGAPQQDTAQDLMTTARLVHSYALGHLAGAPDCMDVINAGMTALRTAYPEGHRDAEFGGFLPIPRSDETPPTEKQAYGHVFVLLAAASAKAVDHPEADALLQDASEIITEHFWDDTTGRLEDEFTRDWQRFSDYRGMNANMHGVEAFLAAFEITGNDMFLERAERILRFFTGARAEAQGWRIPEHYHADWTVDADYAGHPMFRPAGTTPGHSFEFGRLLLQCWDMGGRTDRGAPHRARMLIDTAWQDAWQVSGGLAYTLDKTGKPLISDRYWWPVTEAIGAYAALLKADPRDEHAQRYAQLWDCARALFIDEARGGWFPEVDAAGQPVDKMFTGKPDIYHALQADLFPLLPGLSGAYDSLDGLLT